jgi:predicted nucleic acid-binding protein
MSKLEIERVESSKELGLIAGRLKANNRISFADSWIAATAKSYGATLVHKDPEFDQLKEEIKLLHLPYKK